MKIEGKVLNGLEVGNAWGDLYDPAGATPGTNWIVGQAMGIPEGSLRFMAQDRADPAAEQGRGARNLAIKWFVHEPAHPAEWGARKPTSGGRTMSLLANSGRFELTFAREGETCRVILEAPGDLAIWGPGLEHEWRPIERSTVLTIRWVPLEIEAT